MGDLVAGIGDEVLLFGAFFLLSILMVTLISRWKQQNQQGQRPVQGQRPELQDQRPESQDQIPESQDQRPESQDQIPESQDQSPESQDQIPESQDQSPESQDQRPETHDKPPEPPKGDEQEEVGNDYTTSQAHPATDEPPVGELRSRFHPSSPGSGTGTSAGAAGTETRDSGGNAISIRLILPQNSLTVSVAPSSTLTELARTYFQEDLAANRQVRFIYRGRILSDDSQTLEELEITDNCALHVHVGRPRPQGTPENRQEQDVLDISGLFVPLFGVILAATWVAMFCFPDAFSLMSKLFLFALSMGYVLLTYVTVFAR